MVPIETWANISKCCNLRINCLWNERSWSWLLLVIAVIALQFCNSFDLFPLSLGSYWKDKRVVSAVTARAARTRTALPRKVDHWLPIPRPTLAFSSPCARTHTLEYRVYVCAVCVCARARVGYLDRIFAPVARLCLLTSFSVFIIMKHFFPCSLLVYVVFKM